MSKILVVVESSTKGKQIQKYLGSEYVVKACVGHIADLVTSEKNRLGIEIDNGFKPIYGFLPQKKDVIRSIKDAAEDASLILLATDPDREGSAIAMHLAKALASYKKPMKRVLFKEVTKNEILKAVASAGEIDKAMCDAQQARRVLDRLVGFMVSPFLIDLLGKNLSAGRVQSVAVRMIVDREREIENFKPEEYWPITAWLGKDLKFRTKLVEKVLNKERADIVKAQLEKDTFKVIDVIKEEKSKKAPPPLETATLQQFASSRFKVKTANTMKAAQSLYENGYITYHRVDSLRSSPEAIKLLREWLDQQGYGCPTTPNFFASKGIVQDGHEAIRPTNLENHPDKTNLSGDEKKVYTLIWERFVASQMKPALFDTVAVTVKSSSGHILKAGGKTLKAKGWLEIIHVKEDDEELPELNNEDVLTLMPPGVKAEQKFTQPPSRYKEHSLVEELKSNGIGRPSTYAALITKITDRDYVETKNDTFYPTDKGKKVVDLLVKFFNFMEYKYTADMEDKLDLIADGKLEYLKMITEFYKDFMPQLDKAKLSNSNSSGVNCAECGSGTILKSGKFGKYLQCSNSECKKTAKAAIEGEEPKPTKKAVDGEKCPKCDAPMFLRKSKHGEFLGCSKYPKCNGLKKTN